MKSPILETESVFVFKNFRKFFFFSSFNNDKHTKREREKISQKKKEYTSLCILFFYNSISIQEKKTIKMNKNWIVSKLCNTNNWVPGITVDNNGNIYYTTSSENIYLVNKDNINTESQILINIKDAELRGIIWNRNNILYICDWNNHRILSYSIDTRNLSILAGNGEKGYKDGNMKEAQFRYPRGITMDKNGDLYITDFHHVRKINLSKETVETIAGSNDKGYNDGEAKNAKFNVPIGITVSDDNTIYVADYYNHCIRKIKNDIVSTIAGIPRKYGNQDGSLSNSKFSCPCGIHLDIDGSIIISEGSNKLRRIDINNKLVTSISIPEIKEENIYSLSGSLKRTLYIGTKNAIYKVKENVWKYERYLWIGYLKEKSSYCYLSSLPKEIIKEIASYLKKK